MKHSSPKREEGVALILTLLFVVLLTVLVVEFAYEAQVEASYSLNSENDYQVRLAARSAVYKGISVLENDRLQAELAAAGGTTTTTTTTTTGNTSGSPADSRYSSWALPATFEPMNDAVSRATITDEFGKINLNALVFYNGNEKFVREHLRIALQEFFRLRGESAGAEVNPEALVESIIDWIDEDDETDGDGAEADFYQASENPYACKNGPMDSLDELLLIKGMSTELFFGVKGVDPPQLPLSEFLTVHGDWLGRINPNTMYIDLEAQTCDVLEAMCAGWEDPAGFEIEMDREGIINHLLSAQDETATFQSVDELEGLILSANLTPPQDPNNPRVVNRRDQDRELRREAIRHMFTVYSHIFRIHGDAMMDDILVRNEAFVLRIPQELDWPNGALAVQDELRNPWFDLLEVSPEGEIQEFYRILSWKAIQ